MSQSAQYSHMHTIFQKQMSFEAQYNKNMRLTIDKPDKYRTWIMREQLWSQRKTHWAKMICCGGTSTVKCQPIELKRLKWRYIREDIESSRRGKSSDIQEEGCTIVDRCPKDGVSPRAAAQHLFVQGLSRKLKRVRLVCSWKIKVALPKRWSSHYSLAKIPIHEEKSRL